MGLRLLYLASRSGLRAEPPAGWLEEVLEQGSLAGSGP